MTITMTPENILNHNIAEPTNNEVVVIKTDMSRNNSERQVIPSRLHLLFQLLIIFLASFVAAEWSFAANYYVDGSCSNVGNGLADQCASSPSGPGAFKDPQSCFSAVVAGDTCFIKNGTYVTNSDGVDTRVDGGFSVAHSGTSSNRITISNYPGHSPVLVNCTTYSTEECGHQTISTNGNGYITFSGLTVVGGFYLLNGSRGTNTKSIEIKNCDISVGWYGDGNWSAIYMEQWEGNWVHHNRIHDLKQSPGALGGGAAIKLYTAVNSVIEYNTIEAMSQCVRCQGIDDKQDSVNNIHRFNYFKDVPYSGVRINNQNRDYPASSGTKIYGNVFNNVGGGVDLLLNINGIDIYNNTLYSVDFGFGSIQNSISNVRVFNNIVNFIASRGDSTNTNYYGSNPSSSNFNVFQSGKAYRTDSQTFTSLASYQSGTSLDINSRENNCQFVNPTAGNFQLQSGSPCKGIGKAGGTSLGALMDVGAYGIAPCVGHTCSTTGDPLSPASPRNLRVQ